MKPFLSHLQVNVAAANVSFYSDLLKFLEWKVVYEDVSMVGAASVNGDSVWFVGAAKDVTNDYDGPGVNHIAFGAESQADVDKATAYLSERKIAPVFDTPRHRPEFAQSEDQTYYQVMFETPDRLLIEVVYIGPKQA